MRNPLGHDRPVAEQVAGQPPLDLPHGDPFLGLRVLVAPVSQAAGAREQGGQSTPGMGDVFGRMGDSVPPHPMAPPLHCVIRGVLQRREVPTEGIDSYLKNLGSLARYDCAFRRLWSLFVDRGLCPESASVWDVASLLLRLHEKSPSQARHAYAGMLLVPGFEQLRFCPLFSRVGKAWNASQPRYAAFWDAGPLIRRLASTPLAPGVEALRDRLIISWRLLQLSRSVDLARTYRQVSMVGDVPFVWVQRKGWRSPRWEEVVCVPGLPDLCPWILLKRYTAATADVPAGSPLLRGLRPPYAPLGAGTVGSVTRRILASMGVRTTVWGPHSTRGAGVLMYKGLGLSAEEVCEVGRWKNAGAFSDHYLRLGAPRVAGRRVSEMVHSVSSGAGAEPDRSRTPRSPEGDLGGRDLEGGAPRPDETC